MDTMSQNPGNTITLPLDLPEVKITAVQKNEHGDYIIMVESTKGYARFANIVVVKPQNYTPMEMSLKYAICLYWGIEYICAYGPSGMSVLIATGRPRLKS